MNTDWSALFVPSGSLVEIFIRGTVMYLGIFIMLRLLPRRQIGSLGVADLIVVVLIADASSNGMSGEYKSITEGLLLVASILFWDYAIDWVDHHLPQLRLNEGKPVILASEGRLHHAELKNQRMSVDEMLAQIRIHGLEHVGQVKKAVLEGDGRISVIPAANHQDEDSKKPR
jgi:uncharacterized membrane protein YcaP (DUF421 family)